MTVLSRKPGGSGGGGAPSGPAGGVLSGTYPNPGYATTPYAPGGTDVAVADGGTGASTAAAARTNLGVINSAILFDSTLGGDAASIDTGAAGIAAGYNVLEVYIIARTTEVVDISSVLVTLNADGGANYDRQTLRGSNATASAVASLAQTSWALGAPGASQHAGSVGVLRLSIPGYTQTVFHKVAESTVSVPDDTAANNRFDANSLRWRSTAAITRMAVAAGSGNLLAGSRLLIYGR